MRRHKNIPMRRTRLLIVITLFLLLSAISPTLSAYDLTLKNTPAQACFSPRGGCTEAIVKEIDRAGTEILVQAYSFTSAPIAKALVEAKKRMVSVEVVLDKSQRSEKYTSATFIANARIPTYIDAAHAIAHNKIIVIDRQTVITGSFNFTKAAEEKNAENVIIIKNKELALLYINNWAKHKGHSEPYGARY